MRIPITFIACAAACVLCSFFPNPDDTRVRLTSVDDDVLRFSTPYEHRRPFYAVSWLFLFVMLIAPVLFQLHALPLRALVYEEISGPLLILLFLDAASLSEFTINVKARTYEMASRWPWKTRTYQTPSRWPWYTKVKRGPLDDFRAVYVSDRGSVGLVYKRPGLRLDRVLPIGSAGFGGDAAWLAQEVGRRTGLPVVNSL